MYVRVCVCVGVGISACIKEHMHWDGVMVTSSASLLPFERSLWSRIASQLRSSFGHDAQVPTPRAEERGYLDIWQDSRGRG